MAARLRRALVAIPRLLALGLCRPNHFIPSTRLDPPPGSSAGRFLIPGDANTQVLLEASLVEIRWTSQYPSIDVFLVRRSQTTDHNDQYLIAKDVRQELVSQLKCPQDDCSKAFSLRAIDSTGNGAHGDFWSGEFWLNNSTTTLPPSPVKLSQPSSASTVFDSHQTTRQSIAAPPSLTQAKALADSSSLSPTPTTTPKTPSRSTIGGSALGAGIGGGLAFLTLIAFLIWTHHKKKKHAGLKRISDESERQHQSWWQRQQQPRGFLPPYPYMPPYGGYGGAEGYWQDPFAATAPARTLPRPTMMGAGMGFDRLFAGERTYGDTRWIKPPVEAPGGDHAFPLELEGSGSMQRSFETTSRWERGVGPHR